MESGKPSLAAWFVYAQNPMVSSCQLKWPFLEADLLLPQERMLELEKEWHAQCKAMSDAVGILVCFQFRLQHLLFISISALSPKWRFFFYFGNFHPKTSKIPVTPRIFRWNWVILVHWGRKKEGETASEHRYPHAEAGAWICSGPWPGHGVLPKLLIRDGREPIST